MIPIDGNEASPDIRFHKQVAEKHNKDLHLKIKDIQDLITGHLMVIKKQTWLTIREKAREIGRYETIEGVDTAISRAALYYGYKILLMRGIYVLHYCRLSEGYPHRRHLGYKAYLHIITPCTRPENLSKIADSININRGNHRWYVVFDAQKLPANLPKVSANVSYYAWHDPKSTVGHAQRNHALGLISDRPVNDCPAYVYFLDDDTLMHPDLFKTLEENTSHDFIHFDQAQPDGTTKRIGGTVKVNHIDTGSAIVSRKLIGNTRFNITKYNADGFFWEEIMRKTQKAKYIPQILSVYNQLNP
jgi:hypothetical protein